MAEQADPESDPLPRVSLDEVTTELIDAPRTARPSQPRGPTGTLANARSVEPWTGPSSLSRSSAEMADVLPPEPPPPPPKKAHRPPWWIYAAGLSVALALAGAAYVALLR